MKIVIGYDPIESEAAYVLQHSIMRHASITPEFILLNKQNLRGIYKRERGPLESTEFSITRFLTPYLCHYEGYAIFMDCDMICRDDIAKLWAWRDDRYSVRVVKHDHVPQEEKKFLDQIQTSYAFKNWSSVMLFNNEKCKNLTPEYINTAAGLDLHQFKWTEKDLIGDLPSHWNHLADVEKPDRNASLVHWTLGGPYFEAYRNAEHHCEYWTNRTLMLSIKKDK